MNNKIIKLKEYGNSLGTREFGQKLREEIISYINTGYNVLVDFGEINIISSAFADELFGKLFLSIGEDVFKNKIKINNFKDDNTKQLILLMINQGIEFRRNLPKNEHRKA